VLHGVIVLFDYMNMKRQPIVFVLDTDCDVT
jgi:hypothetical protein